MTEADGNSGSRFAKRELLTFLAVLTLLTTAAYLWIFNGGDKQVIPVVLMMYCPGIAAIVTSVICKGNIKGYGWKPGKIRFLIYAYALPLVIAIIAYGACWITGLTEFTTKEVVMYKWARMAGFSLPAPFIAGVLSKMSIGFIFTCLIVFGEEAGWSGFLTPKLLERYSFTTTSLATGVLWSVWHFPAFFYGVYGQGTPLWIALPSFTMVLTGYSFIRSILVLKSKSLWTGVVLHSSGNIILMGMFYEMTVHEGNAAYYVSETGIITGMVCLISAVIFTKFQIIK